MSSGRAVAPGEFSRLSPGLNESERRLTRFKWVKTLFTSADNYVISRTDLSGASPAAAALLLAAGLAIDVVFKESA